MTSKQVHAEMCTLLSVDFWPYCSGMNNLAPCLGTGTEGFRTIILGLG